tara:strand:- start:2999 stop:3337 length:339 start_codon:yes stop_codon:yes gene_type:complete
MKALLITITLLFSLSSYAGPGHGHSHGGSKAVVIDEGKTIEIAKFHINRLVKSEKLDGSWNEAKYDSSEKKKFGSKTEWVVSFGNEKGIKGKKLYVFLKLSGEFVAANFTGK